MLDRVLNSLSLDELPLDFIRTTFFSDLYKGCEVLGAGSFGVVLKVIELSSNQEYAIKVFIKLHFRLFQDNK